LSEKLQFVVGTGDVGCRLDDFLAARLMSLSRMRIAALVERGACAVNNEAAHGGRRLCAGDSVEFALADDAPNSMTPEALPLEIVHEDEHIIVVSKPTGLLIHPTRDVKQGTLANALTYHLNRLRNSDCGLRIGESTNDEGDAVFNPQSDFDNSLSENPQSAIRIPQFIRPGIVHRLDRDTSGLLVVAKTQSALSRLTQHFHRRLVEKRYLAVVAGRVEPQEQTIIAPIGRDPDSRPRWRVMEDGGRHAETHVRVIEHGARRTLVELEPVTGRTNQLRIHCTHMGHAIVGDRLHGGDEHARMCLHAARLAFHHPATNEWVEFSMPLPQEVLSALQ
jgi:23S rRNA pseudouridine1911/1915/1917 synthase